MSDIGLERRIKQLEQSMSTRDTYIKHLEEILKNYSDFGVIKEQELEEARDIATAQDMAQELMHKELLEYDRFLKAQEAVRSLMEREQKEKDEIIAAHESLQNLYAQEKKESDQLIKAQEQLQEYADKERKAQDEVIKAQEHLAEFAQEEQKEKDKLINAHESLRELSEEEAREKDKLLQAHEAIHKLSQEERKEQAIFSNAQESVENLYKKDLRTRNQLTNDILYFTKKTLHKGANESLRQDLMKKTFDVVRANRAFIASAEVEPQITEAINFDKKLLDSQIFSYAKSMIKNVIQTQESIIVIDKKIEVERDTENISFIAIPLVYKDECYGVFYLDAANEIIFKKQDLVLAEIFTFLMVIAEKAVK